MQKILAYTFIYAIIKIGKEVNKMEELKNIKVAVRWARNGRKYVWDNPTQKKITELIKKYDIDQICDGCLWLCQ